MRLLYRYFAFSCFFFSMPLFHVRQMFIAFFFIVLMFDTFISLIYCDAVVDAI